MNGNAKTFLPKWLVVLVATAATLVIAYVVVGFIGSISDRADRIRIREVRKNLVKLITQYNKTHTVGKQVDKDLYNGILQANKEYRDIMWRHPEWAFVWEANIDLPEHFEPLD